MNILCLIMAIVSTIMLIILSVTFINYINSFDVPLKAKAKVFLSLIIFIGFLITYLSLYKTGTY